MNIIIITRNVFCVQYPTLHNHSNVQPSLETKNTAAFSARYCCDVKFVIIHFHPGTTSGTVCHQTLNLINHVRVWAALER